MRFLVHILLAGTAFGFCVTQAHATCTEYVSGDPAWKLIRDLLPERFRLENWEAVVEQVTDVDELKSLLIRKLQEETIEFSKNPSAEEMADLLEVIEALQKIHQLDPQEVNRIKIEKATSKGRFQRGYVLKIESLRKK